MNILLRTLTDFLQDSEYKLDLIQDVLASKEMHIKILFKEKNG